MDKQNQKKKTTQKDRVPQLQIRSGLSAGGDLPGCLEKLQYWRNRYQQMCGGY